MTTKHEYFYGVCFDCGKPVNNYNKKPKPRCAPCWKKFMHDHPEAHPFYKTGKVMNKAGYVLVIHRTHPRRNKLTGKVLEHILVAEAKLGRPMKPNERVHHINHIPWDNRPENIEVLQSHKDHMAKHRLATHCKRCGKPGQMRRGYCYHHYETWRAVGFIGDEPPPTPVHYKACRICGKRNVAFGLCQNHYYAFIKRHKLMEKRPHAVVSSGHIGTQIGLANGGFGTVTELKAPPRNLQ